MKYLFDTCTLVEAARRKGHPKVKAWAAALLPAQIYLCPVIMAEVMAGIFRLPERAARQRETAQIRQYRQRFGWADIDERTAVRWGLLHARAPATIPPNDLWLGALALNHGLIIATRDSHFHALEVPMFNPWL